MSVCVCGVCVVCVCVYLCLLVWCMGGLLTCTCGVCLCYSGESTGGGSELLEGQAGWPTQPVPVSQTGSHGDPEGWLHRVKRRREGVGDV